MQTKQFHFHPGFNEILPADIGSSDVAFVFGDRELLDDQSVMRQVRASLPGASIVGCSTAGEIFGTRVFDHTLAVTSVRFDHSRLRTAAVGLNSSDRSFAAGVELGRDLGRDGPRHVIVFSDGLSVNGSELVRGLKEALPPNTPITGGLAGDRDRFLETRVVIEGEGRIGHVCAVGFYGDRLRTGFGSLGGWDAFGPERRVTASRDNVLFELDGISALETYRRYLGPYADNLPASGLLFPLTIQTEDDEWLVRTILGVNAENDSMTFAGDIPVGCRARFMKANFDRLIQGAGSAAKYSVDGSGQSPDLALLISCVGRKLVLSQRIEEEVEAVRDVLGPAAVLAGFYSYGEISPLHAGRGCELHNQTMTITTLSER